MLVAENISHLYKKGSLLETKALSSVNLQIDDGEFLGVIGHTGCGKTTLLQLFAGLLKPTSGKIFVDGIDIFFDKSARRKLCFSIGLVMQYPEHQLFEETVEKDVAFGPTNMGLLKSEVKARVYEALHTVGIEEKYFDRSPFELSGGQRRRVAIAGVLAMQPRVLILDEPTAGLDYLARNEILNRVKKLHDEQNITVILVSHRMEDIAKFADRIVVMNCGVIDAVGGPEEIFSDIPHLESIGLSVPQITKVAQLLKQNAVDIDQTVYTVEQAATQLKITLSSK